MGFYIGRNPSKHCDLPFHTALPCSFPVIEEIYGKDASLFIHLKKIIHVPLCVSCNMPYIVYSIEWADSVIRGNSLAQASTPQPSRPSSDIGEATACSYHSTVDCSRNRKIV